MKKLIYLFIAFIGLTITSCEPMEDVQDEINAELDSERAVADREYTLTEDDYSAVGLNYPNFNSEEDARELIPSLLSTQYPNYGAGSSVNVTFDIYDPIRVEDYTLTADDYETAGLEEAYFTSSSQIVDALEDIFPAGEDGDYIELTYTVVAEDISYEFTSEDYDLAGEELATDYPDPADNAAQYSSFEIREDRDSYWSDEMILEAINIVLGDNFDDVTNQIYSVSYTTYNGGAGDGSMTVQFNGNAYVPFGGTSYEISDADFDEIGGEFAETYPEPAASAIDFGNFDTGYSDASVWSDNMILEAINFLLGERFPNAEDGAEFAVSYETYDGTRTTEVMNVVKSGDDFVLDTSATVVTITATDVFAVTNGDWGMPFTLDMGDYEAMGQSYANFSNEDLALYRIGIYLGMQFPFAEEGDITAVSFDLYDSGDTSTEYVNFIFEDGSFDPIPSVRSSSLQFGNVDGEWVPDNTIRYSLIGSDYGIIADALEDTYSGPVSSMARYNNFDRRSGNSAYWSDDMILEAMQILLNSIAPNAEVGQQYVLTYEIYNGSNGTEEISLIKNEAGEWVINE